MNPEETVIEETLIFDIVIDDDHIVLTGGGQVVGMAATPWPQPGQHMPDLDRMDWSDSELADARDDFDALLSDIAATRTQTRGRRE